MLLTRLVESIAERGKEYVSEVGVRIHTVNARTGVRGNAVADLFAKFACTSPPDAPGNYVSMGEVPVPRKYAFWVTAEKGGS